MTQNNEKKCIIITSYIEGLSRKERDFIGYADEHSCEHGEISNELQAYLGEEDITFAKDLRILASDSFVICADGGYSFARAFGIAPDILIGDFDSYSYEQIECLSDEKIDLAKGSNNKDSFKADFQVIRLNPIKDDTDTGMALAKALELGFSHVTIVGGIGGRLSHTIAILDLLADYAGKFKNIELVDPLRHVYVLAGESSISIENKASFELKDNDSDIKSDKKENGDKNNKNICTDGYISLFSHTESCEGVSISGVFYPLDNVILTNTFPLGVSNAFTEDEARVSLKKGILFIITEFC